MFRVLCLVALVSLTCVDRAASKTLVSIEQHPDDAQVDSVGWTHIEETRGNCRGSEAVETTVRMRLTQRVEFLPLATGWDDEPEPEGNTSEDNTDKQTEEKPEEEKPTEEKPAEEKPADEQPTDEQPAGDQPTKKDELTRTADSVAGFDLVALGVWVEGDSTGDDDQFDLFTNDDWDDIFDLGNLTDDDWPEPGEGNDFKVTDPVDVMVGTTKISLTSADDFDLGKEVTEDKEFDTSCDPGNVCTVKLSVEKKTVSAC